MRVSRNLHNIVRKVTGGTQSSPSFTHFLSLPVITETSRPQFERSFKVLEEHLSELKNELPGVDNPRFARAAMGRIGSLQISLGILNLDTPEREQHAISTLERMDIQSMLADSKARNRLVATTAPVVHFESLVTRTPKSRWAESLEAIPKQVGLHKFGEQVRQVFLKEDLLADNKQLKLYLSIMNYIYIPPEMRARYQTKERRSLPFDAQPLQAKMKDFAWATNVTLEKMAIYKRKYKRILNEDGELADVVYEELASTSLLPPSNKDTKALDSR